MSLESDVKFIRKEMSRKNIGHFSSKDIVVSFFGALLVGSTFMFRTGLLKINMNLQPINVFAIFVVNILVLAGEIYFIGYSRVRDKKKRPFLRFLSKRLLTIYCMSLSVGIILAFLYDIVGFMGVSSWWGLIRLCVGTAFPASIGAVLTDLLKKF